jgi:hypothetical protein
MFEALTIKTIRHRFQTNDAGILHLAKQNWQAAYCGKQSGHTYYTKGTMALEA